MNRRRQTRWIPLLLAAGVPLIGTAVHAEEGSAAPNDGAGTDRSQLDTVTVTAERTKSNVQRTAQSVSVRRGDELEAQGKYSLSQILEDVAGVTGGAATSANGSFASGTDSAAGGLTIRGIISNRGTGGSITSVAPAAAIYVDGVYEGVGGSYDIDRVEVLRGPQGTLYGRSATSGLIAVHTIDPVMERTELNAAVEAGSYGLRRYAAAVNLPLGDKLAVRFAANHFERNGYDSAEGGALSTDGGRLKLLYKPSADLSVLVGYAFENNTTATGGTTISLATPDSYLYTPTPLGSGSNRFRQYWAQLDWNVGLGTLTYLPAVRTWTSSGTAYVETPGIPSVKQTMATPSDRFNTQELRLASPKGSKIDWQLGALYYRNTLSNTNEVDFLPPVGGMAFRSVTREKATDANGVYGQLTYPLADAWRLTAGARYDTTKVSVDQDYTSITGVTQTLSGADGRQSFKNTTYKLRLEHDIDARKLVYASVSTGFSPGDISVATGASGNPIAPTLKAETLTAFEIGSKNRLLGNRLQLNGAFYYYDYGGFQTQGVNITPQLPYGTFATLSAPATVWGGELELQYKLTADDRLGGDISYTNARFRDRTGTQIPTGAGSYVSLADYFAEDKIPGVIPFRLNANYTHSFYLEGGASLSVTAAARYMSAYHSSALTPAQIAAGKTPYSAVSGQWVGDLNANWQSSDNKYSLSAYVRNVGNNRYKTSVAVNDGATTATPYDPRTLGVIFRVDF